MMDPAAFAEARLAEDEAIAQRNIDKGLLDDDEKTGPGYPDYQTYRDDDTEAADKYLMCFRPRRMLREVEAGRRILARYADCLARVEDPDYPQAVARDQAREYEDFVLPNLLTRWADHEDYDPEWRP